MTPRPTTILAALALAATPAAALAQPAITIDVENPVLMPGESTTVTMYAGFGGTDYAMAGVAGDLLISSGVGGFTDARILAPMDRPPGAVTPGEATGLGFEGFRAVQVHAPLAEIYADPTNPVGFWQATFTAPMDPAAPFEVRLATAMAQFDVYLAETSRTSESRLDDLTEGAATIRVIPAPASALVLALGAVAVRRRR